MQFYKVKEVAEMVGVSIRTIHHYDETGILTPQSVTPSGHRLYSMHELERLQQILFFREIGLSLQEIKAILDSPEYDRVKVLAVHRDLLIQRKKRIETIIETVNKTIQSAQGGNKMSAPDMFDGLNPENLEEHKRKYAAGGYEHTVVLKDDGTVWSWGKFGDEAASERYEPGPVKLLTDVKMVAAASGHYHSFAVKHDGTVWGWGSNSHGQLGSGAPGVYADIPVQVPGLGGVISVSAGVFHTLALRADKAVWSWGPNWYGQLGDGTDTERLTPAAVEGLTDVREVAAGFFHSMALKEDGTVLRWGGFGDSTEHFPIRDESWTPVKVEGVERILAIAAGGSHSIALRDDGTVWSWGYNTEGQLGDGAYADDCFTAPRLVGGLEQIKAVAAGGAFSMALKADGTVWTWGTNSFGELGDGTYERRSAAAQIPGLSEVIAIDAGTKHAMAMKKDGSVWLWGSNNHGQLGNRIVDSRNQPYLTFQAARIL